ncbi:MAG: SOS response-associated peptidase [Syntrophomonadaceae bacterium]
MCGRYTLTIDQDELSERFGCPVIIPDYRPRYNTAPGQQMPVVIKQKGENRMVMMRWGLIPHWCKDDSMGARLFNARMESVAEKPSFRDSLLTRRCIVPADGYYEWLKINNTKQPLRIVKKSRQTFAFAGLWDKWVDQRGNTRLTFTIITTEPVESIRHIHNRMPLILSREYEELWLEKICPGSRIEVKAFLSQFKPENELQAYPISNMVNSSANEHPELIDFCSGGQ